MKLEYVYTGLLIVGFALITTFSVYLVYRLFRGHQ